MDANVLIIYPRYMAVHGVAKELIQQVAKVREIVWETPTDVASETFRLIEDADAVLVRLCRLDEELLSIAEKLKIIAIHGVGIDNVNVDVATQKGIIVTNTPYANTVSVAEFTIGLILCLARKISRLNEIVKSKGWKFGATVEHGSEISGKTLGIIGLGRIGSLVAEKGKALNMNVIAFDPYATNENAQKIGVKLTDLETLLKASDFITIHVPLTAETKHLIGEEELKKMKKEAFLINVARGGVIDEEALYIALREKRIAGAALDVMEFEPPDPNNPLLNLENVIITPHAAGSTKESLIKMSKTAAEEIVRVLNNKPPLFPVNLSKNSMVKLP